jgi:hypothetical protein
LLNSVLGLGFTESTAQRDHRDRACSSDRFGPKPRLFGKFRARFAGGGVLRTLFIKLQFILRQWRRGMVNRTCRSAQRSPRQAVNAVLSGCAIG